MIDPLYIIIGILMVALIALLVWMNRPLPKEHFEAARGLGVGQPTIVKFYAEWCGHCKAMREAWDKFAEKCKDSPIQIVAIDGTDGQGDGLKLATAHNVRGFPTVIYLPHGLGVDEERVVYNGDRSYASLLQFHNQFLL